MAWHSCILNTAYFTCYKTNVCSIKSWNWNQIYRFCSHFLSAVEWIKCTAKWRGEKLLVCQMTFPNFQHCKTRGMFTSWFLNAKLGREKKHVSFSHNVHCCDDKNKKFLGYSMKLSQTDKEEKAHRQFFRWWGTQKLMKFTYTCTCKLRASYKEDHCDPYSLFYTKKSVNTVFLPIVTQNDI